MTNDEHADLDLLLATIDTVAHTTHSEATRALAEHTIAQLRSPRARELLRHFEADRVRRRVLQLAAKLREIHERK